MPTLFHNLTGSPYEGLPTKDVDSVWTTLLSSMHIRESADELRRDNQQSIALAEGGSYLEWLGVYEVSCW